MYPEKSRSTATISCLFFVAMLLIFSGRPAGAATSSGKTKTTGLEPIVITPLRYAETTDRSLSSVSVITREDIQRNQPKDIVQALAGVPGVTITRSGGYGKLSSVFLRGTGSSQVLVLVNGVRVGAITNGAAAWQYIPVSQVKRIEVVRGPRSSLYGPDAMGGVIQIFTRHGAWDTQRAGAAVGGGSYGTGRGNAWFSWGNDRTKMNISAGLFHTDGIDARTDTGPHEEDDHDGYENRNFNLSLSHRFRERDLFSVSYFRAQGYSQFDPPAKFGGVDLDHFIQAVLSAKYRLAVTDRDTLRLQVGHFRGLATSRREDHTGTHSRFNSNRRSASLINRYDFGPVTWLVGTDYWDGRLSSSTKYTATRRRNHGLFTELSTHYFGIDGQLSGRYDHNQAYGDHFTGQIGLGYDITRAYRVEASYGNAFVAPSFNLLYYPGYANPNLKPERSRSAELDFLGQYGWGGWRVNLYQTKIRDLIASQPPKYIPENTQHARIRGVELTTHTHIGATTIKASAGYMQPINRDTGHDLSRRTRFTGYLAVNHRFGAFSIGAHLNANGPRYNDPANAVRMGGFALLGLNATYRFTSHWRIVATADNLLDKQYQTIKYYRNPGRTGYLKLIWNYSEGR